VMLMTTRPPGTPQVGGLIEVMVPA
jgi:hypothetical protein